MKKLLPIILAILLIACEKEEKPEVIVIKEKEYSFSLTNETGYDMSNAVLIFEDSSIFTIPINPLYSKDYFHPDRVFRTDSIKTTKKSFRIQFTGYGVGQQYYPDLKKFISKSPISCTDGEIKLTNNTTLFDIE